MAEAKTKPTQLSAEEYVSQISDPARRTDCQDLLKLMSRVTKQPPVMWGASIVGFGSYRYTYASGHSGESCATGFSARKSDISIYLMVDTSPQQELLSRLGKHKMGKACLSIKRLADVDHNVLEQLITESFIEVGRRHGSNHAKPT
ncbi:DUF1801 domain-containing protein [Pseudoxanthomonas sp. UTMC 1351]|uniref:DUF1801 domain-containing protein n=1 Tax=Pseudoxanthomonas sp. UTMC 1351 TaxID=2695853 RepID=UPI0034CE9D16